MRHWHWTEPQRWSIGVLIASCLILAFGALPRTASAQFSFSSQLSQEDRERVFQEIAGEAAIVEREHHLLKRVIAFVQPTVVHIEAKKLNEGFGGRTVDEAGSGVLIEYQDRDYVLTNRHVVKHATPANIQVQLADGRTIYPTRIWADIETDVAVMLVDAKGLITARIGDSSKVEIGDYVLAIGSPFGLSHSVTHGIISAKGRRDLKLGDSDVIYQDFFQTDAAINPGNSGGPLLNLRGEVIGINTAIASSSGGNEGIGFSIPVNVVMFIAQQLVDRGSVIRAFFGVTLDSVYDAKAAERIGLPRPVGALVKSVTDKSAADLAHVKPGDVIVEFDGVVIEDDNHLVNQVKLTPVGKEVDILLYRQGKMIRVKAKLGPPQRVKS